MGRAEGVGRLGRDCPGQSHLGCCLQPRSGYRRFHQWIGRLKKNETWCLCFAWFEMSMSPMFSDGYDGTNEEVKRGNMLPRPVLKVSGTTNCDAFAFQDLEANFSFGHSCANRVST